MKYKIIDMNNLVKISLMISGMIMISVFPSKSQEIRFSCTNLNMQPGATMLVSNGTDFVNDSVKGVFGGTVVFYGSTDTLYISGSRNSSFHHLVVDSGAVVSLHSDILIDSALSLKKGIINTSGKKLTMFDNAEIEGSFSGENMVALNSNGKLTLKITKTGTYFFPIGEIGSTNDYSPAQLEFKSGVFNNAELGIGLTDAKHPSNSSLTHFIRRYWTVNQTGISNFTCDVEFNYLNEDVSGNEANIYGGKWNGSYWVPLEKVALNKITGNVSSFSDFTAGELSVLQVDAPDEENVEILVEGSSVSVKFPENSGFQILEIYNSLGQKVIVRDISKSDFYQVKISEGKGIYLLKVTGNSRQYSKKLAIY